MTYVIGPPIAASVINAVKLLFKYTSGKARKDFKKQFASGEMKVARQVDFSLLYASERK